MAHQIRKIETADGLVVLTVGFAPAEGEREIRLSPGAAEVWANEMLDAARKLRRTELEAAITSLRRQSQQIETMLQAAERRLADMDGQPFTLLRPATAPRMSPREFA